MKSALGLCLALVLAASPLVRAEESAPRFTNATFEQTEESMLIGLASNNHYVMATIARTVKDLKALYPDQSLNSMIIPLMGIVKNDRLPSFVRTTAAIALHDLRSARGDYAIQQTAIFTNDEKVKNVCNWLTYYRLLEKQPGFVSPTAELLLERFAPEPLAEVPGM